MEVSLKINQFIHKLDNLNELLWCKLNIFQLRIHNLMANNHIIFQSQALNEQRNCMYYFHVNVWFWSNDLEFGSHNLGSNRGHVWSN